MKKNLLYILGFLLFTASATGQFSVSISPPSTLGSGPASSTDIGAYAEVTNTSDDTLDMLWTRRVISMEHEWTSWICDLNNCYLPEIGECPESRPNILAPGSSMNFEVHVGPAGVEGEAELEIDLYSAADPQNILGTINVQFETSSTSVTDLNTSELRIYPNPTTSFFQLNHPADVAQVVVYNIIGNKMREFDARNISRFDISDLTQGIYIVRILNANHQVLRTVRLSKR
jgi:hypothetical protein